MKIDDLGGKPTIFGNIHINRSTFNQTNWKVFESMGGHHIPHPIPLRTFGPKRSLPSCAVALKNLKKFRWVASRFVSFWEEPGTFYEEKMGVKPWNFQKDIKDNN